MNTSAAAHCVAAVAVAAFGLTGSGSIGHAQARARNAIQEENRLPGSDGWVPRPSAAIEAYGSEAGVLLGDSLHLHVSTTPGAHYRIEVYRLGWYGGAGGRLVTCLPSNCRDTEDGHPGPLPSVDGSTGETRAQWPVSDTLAIGQDWVSGYYVAKAVLTDGAEAGNAASVAFVVEPSTLRPSAILVVAAENTWQAYNNWGGRSLYAFNSSNREAATHVSFDRPYGAGAQTPFQWEYQAVRFLERRGYDVSYATDAEVDANPNELLRHRLVIVNGHNEYWTKAMRDGFEAARAAGTNLAFLGANDGYWQIRYENDRRTIVEYRSAAVDPESDPGLKTTKFRWLSPPRPECSLLGVQFDSANASGAPTPTDYTVDPASLGDPWFRGTGFSATSTLPGLVGYEWDGVDARCATPPLTALFRATGPPDAAAVRYEAAEGARVFSAGSLQFSWGLDDWNAPGHADPRLQRFMANALDDLRRPAPPIALTIKRARNGVRIHVTLPRDPRVAGARIFTHTSARPFIPGRPAGTCKAHGNLCLVRLKLARGRYRFAAETFDRWGTSAPLFSQATRITLSRHSDRTPRPPRSSRTPAPRARDSGG